MTVFKPVSAHTLGQTAQNVVVVGTGVDNNAIMQKVFDANMQRLVASGMDVDELKGRVSNAITTFNPYESLAISKLGSSSGEKIVKFSDDMLKHVRSSDVDGIGDKMTEVVVLAKQVNINGLVNGGSKVPLIGGLINKFRVGKEKIVGQYDSLSKQIEKLMTEVSVTQSRLNGTIQNLENVYLYNFEEYKNLDTSILVGEVKIEELNQNLEQMKASPSAATNPIEAQNISDLSSIIDRLKKRVHDLKTMQMVAIQTAPMIRMIQSNNRTLIDKFTNLTELTIPSWKKQFVLAIALIEQKNAVALATKIDDTTNDIMKRNADLLKMNSIETAKANERSVVDIETLEYVQKNLIETIDEVQKIKQEGEVARIEAVKKMENMKDELIKKVTDR